MNFKAFPPELRANLSGNHGRNRECSFSQIRNLLKTNTSRISGLPKKWQTGGRDKCLSAAEPSEFLKVWLIRIPSFCVDDSNSVPILPLPIIFFCTIGPGSSIHKLYDLRSPNSQPSELGNLTMYCTTRQGQLYIIVFERNQSKEPPCIIFNVKLAWLLFYFNVSR